MNFNQFSIKLGRFSAWMLLILILLYIITGYGMTKQIIDPVFATYLHNKLLPIPLFAFFILHVSNCVRFALKRWKIFKNNKTADIYAIIFVIILLILFIWLYLR